MNFSSAVVSVPKRLPYARQLAKDINGKVIVDMVGNGSWWGHKMAMLNYSKPYHLILEDDVKLCQDFIEGVDLMCGLFPDHPISLFNMLNFAALNRRAQQLDIAFLGTNGATGQAQLWPTHVLKEFILWCDAHVPEHVPYEDTRLWLWLKQTNNKIYLTCPNLVEHLCPNDSTLGFKGNKRVSADFLGPRSAKLEDWTKNLERAKKTHVKTYDYSPFWKRYRYST